MTATLAPTSIGDAASVVIVVLKDAEAEYTPNPDWKDVASMTSLSIRLDSLASVENSLAVSVTMYRFVVVPSWAVTWIPISVTPSADAVAAVNAVSPAVPEARLTPAAGKAVFDEKSRAVPESCTL